MFLFGILHAIALRLNMPTYTIVTAAVVSAATLLIAPDFWSIQMLLALLVFEAAWRAPISGTWPTTLAGYAFGVYLMHPAFMLLAYKIWGADVNPIPAAVFTFACTLAATEVFHRTPGLRKVA